MSPTASPEAHRLEMDTHQGRPVKKRASLACHQCRGRKIKCDIVETGSPCHNCRMDHVECTTSLSKRTRKYRLQKAQLVWPSALPPKLLPRIEPQQTASSVSAELQDLLVVDCDKTSPNPRLSATHRSDHHTPGVRAASLSSRGEPSATSSTAQEPGDELDLPVFIRRPQPHIRPEELAYLRQRGALSIPETELCEQLLLSFVLYVNPFLPIVDLQELVDGFEGKPGCEVSLILVQAVLFSGTAFVDLQLLLKAGFQNRVAARAYFFEKIKLLYDFGWETDRVILIQATLLHAYWYVSSNDQKDPWYWMGICITLATGIGLNLASTHESLDTKTCHLWRRIWWACVSRDRIMCLMTRRPMRIKEDDTRLPPLMFKDFDTQPLSTQIPSLRDSPFIRDCVCKVMLADMFMSKLNLLMISGRIFTHSYNLQRFDSSNSEWAMFYAPKKQYDLDLNGFDHLQEELQTWSRTLNSYCELSYHDGDCSDETQGSPYSTPTVLFVHRAALKLLHLMAEEALLRPLTFPAGLQERALLSQTNAEDLPTTNARKNISRVAFQMVQIFRDFRGKNLLGYLPPLSVGTILTAVATFLVDIRSAEKSPADVSRHRYHDCLLSLQRLREVWPIAEGTCAMVNQMATNNQMWFARCLKMLAKPTSMTEENPNDQSPTSARRRMQKSGGTSCVGSTIETEIGEEDPTPGRSPLEYVGEHSHVHSGLYNPQVSTYLASMYPFPWVANDFDIFDPDVCPELFMDHSLGVFDVNGSLDNDMAVYPPSLDLIDKDGADMTAIILPESWK